MTPFQLKLKFNQSDKECLEMVKKDGLSLRYVLKKTPEIVLAAVKQNKEAKKHMAGSCFNLRATPKQLIEFYKI
jgi:hypothetical protein